MQGGAGDTYRAAERIGVRAWGGKAGEILGEDHGRASGSVAPWRGRSCQAGPTGQRAKCARRGLQAERGGRAVHDAGRASVGRRALRGRRETGP